MEHKFIFPISISAWAETEDDAWDKVVVMVKDVPAVITFEVEAIHDGSRCPDCGHETLHKVEVCPNGCDTLDEGPNHLGVRKAKTVKGV